MSTQTTTTRTQRLESSLDAASRNLGPVLATRVDPATGHIRGLHRPPYTLPTRPPDEPDPTGQQEGRPLADLTPDEYTLLIDQLLEDWDCPTMTELGLCRAHRLSLDQLDRITDDPAFDRALARIRSIRAKRRPERHAAARAQLFDRLLGLLAQPQDTAARAKEVRLACKHLQTILDTPEPEAEAEQNGGADPAGGAEFHSANAHDEIVGFPSCNPPKSEAITNGGAEFHSAFGRSPNPEEIVGFPSCDQPESQQPPTNAASSYGGAEFHSAFGCSPNPSPPNRPR